MTLRAIVLAAGASSRMGSPKALLELSPGVRCLDHVLRALPQELSPVVVTGAHHAVLEEAVGTRAAVLHHRGWSTGRTGSLQAALRELGPLPSALIWPVDRPGVTARDVGHLLTAWRAAQEPAAGWLAPRGKNGSFGHPMLVGFTVLERMLELGPDEPLHAARSSASPLWSIDVPHSGTALNLDRPEDLAGARTWHADHQVD